LTPHLPPAIALIGVAVLLTVGYVNACITWPFTNCHRCHGDGKQPPFFGGRTFRICRRCHGTGRRLRTGRKVWNFFHRLHGEANR
jgi:hypothetical protein